MPVSISTARALAKAMASDSRSRCRIRRSPFPLEKDHACGHADVQGCHLPCHRNAHEKIAALGHVFMQPVAFCAEDNGGRLGEFHLVVSVLAPFVQAVDPVTALLK